MEPKNVYEVLTDSDWISAMQEELHKFERNQVWHLVPKPKDRTIIGTKWGSEISWMSKEQSPEIRRDWLFKGTIRRKALIMRIPLRQLQELRP